MLVAALGIEALRVALAFAGVGAIVGQGFAAYRHERDPGANTTRIIFCWTVFGFVVGWLLVTIRLVA